MGLTHHDLCFGCGAANVFGLQLEADPLDDGGVRGRFFVKQDHQGPPGAAHGGVLAAALDDVMALALHAEGLHALTTRLEVDFHEPAPVGTFVRLEASVERRDGEKLWLRGAALGGDGDARLADARALAVRVPD